ncbi:MAG: retropepsin-like domain-containing protein [Deltaproteobacteria bacterium]|nr:retropepsin-like domain-containing protein [Deltaproteobacteria bacterium]
MTRYSLERVGSLLLTKAAASGPAGVKVVRLLVDTGSVYTILPVEVLESVGCSPAVSTERVRLITGSGYLIAPEVQVAWFQCLGQKVDQMVVVAHTLPFGSLVDGLLGMDFSDL